MISITTARSFFFLFYWWKGSSGVHVADVSMNLGLRARGLVNSEMTGVRWALSAECTGEGNEFSALMHWGGSATQGHTL